MVSKPIRSPVQESLDKYSSSLVCPYCGKNFPTRYRRDKHVHACPKMPVSVLLERAMDEVIHAVKDIIKGVDELEQQLLEYGRKHPEAIGDEIRSILYSRIKVLYKWFYEKKKNLDVLLSGLCLIDVVRNDENLMNKLNETIRTINELAEWESKRTEKAVEALKNFVELDKKIEPLLKKAEEMLTQTDNVSYIS